MNTRRLIINADDFGSSKSVTDTIIETHKNGIVTSTTLMANMAAAEYACQQAMIYPDLGVGVHLTLTEGHPVSDIEDVPGLIDSNGAFFGPLIQRKRFWLSKKISEQIEKELFAQIERVLDMGVVPTHCDSHHGMHSIPMVRDAMIKVLQRFNIRSARTQVGFSHLDVTKSLLSLPKELFRKWNSYVISSHGIHMPDRKVIRSTQVKDIEQAKELLLESLSKLPEGVYEMIFHPGCYKSNSADFSKIRENDTLLLCCPEIKAAIKEYGVDLISYRDI